MNRFEGRVAVVIGAATGIGAATARRLATEGASVVVADINTAGAAATTADIVDSGGKAVAWSTDLGDEESVKALFEMCRENWSRIDALHNNAAAVGDELGLADLVSDATTVPPEAWDRAINVNLRGTMLSCRYAMPLLIESGHGAIVNTSSIAGVRGAPTLPSYSASKAGVAALTRHVAVRWGAEGVRCNAVAPGGVRTETMGRYLEAGGAPPEMLEQMGAPESIASVVAFLLSDDAAYVNGQEIVVDGGSTIAMTSL